MEAIDGCSRREFRNRVDAWAVREPGPGHHFERVVDQLLWKPSQLEQSGLSNLRGRSPARRWIAKKGYDPKWRRPMARIHPGAPCKRPWRRSCSFGKL